MPIYHDHSYNYFRDLSEKMGLEYIRLSGIPLSSFPLQREKNSNYLSLQAVPVNIKNGKITIATSNPSEKNRLRIQSFFEKEFEEEIDLVVTSRIEITNILSNYFKESFTHDCVNLRADTDYLHSASYTFSLSVKIFILSFLILLVLGLVLDFYKTGMLIELFLAMGTTIIISYKIGLSIHALFTVSRKRKVDITLKEEELPVYTILIPLLREKEQTIATLIGSLNALDYPNHLLDIKFLLEEDDITTQEAINKFELKWFQQIIIIPTGKPRSKPKACNYALLLSFGEYLTIYDAEDCPDSDQLKTAIQLFHNSPKEVACIQAALNFYNSKVNLITRLFTVEYTHWFDFMIPSLSHIRVPVPLGGTSNHFKINVLRELSGWDPYVGTEDAEIGVRLYRHGYRVGTTYSTTYEEANERFGNWFFQRARWAKGYMQTYLINMRDPTKMFKQIGPRSFLGFQCFVGGNVFVQLANFPLWIFMLISIIVPHGFFDRFNLNLVYAVTWYNFIVSNIGLLIVEFISVVRRNLYYLLPYVPLRIFYWIWMSCAGYYAIFELLVRPSFWYKTEHGFSKKKA